MTETHAIIPVIRMEDFASHDPAETIQDLRQACMDVGFFYLKDHPISPSLMDAVFDQSKKFFDLSEVSKKKIANHVLSRGYTAMEEETLDPVNQLTRGDTKEGFYIGREISVDDVKYDPTKLRGPNEWPTTTTTIWTEAECQEFRTVMTNYHEQMSQLGFRIVQLLALAIGLDEDYFDASFQEPIASLRLLHYAAVPSDPTKGIFACGAHSDYGMITLLLTDDTTPGLQIQTKQGEWMDAPPMKNAFVVNLGDMLERWTNGLFRSTRHRVLTASESVERYSIPFFYEPSFDAVVECLDVCCSDERPAAYETTTAGEHLLSKYKQTHRDFQPA
jgi:isopenicillin N synthase-like dioxygenase